MEQTETQVADVRSVSSIEAQDTEQRLVPLSLCRYGADYPGGSINPRKTDRGASAALIATIRADGIVQPLLGWEKGGLYYFSAGDRRLNALFRIHAAARHPNDYPIVFASVAKVMVPIILRRDGNPLELGLQENLNRNDLHPVDKMEGFAALLAGRPEDGIAPLMVEDIAARFSMRPAQVRQSLRLGVLAEPIRQAWRTGALDDPTAEAFTLCKDEKQQLKILERLQKDAGPGGQINPHMVRKALRAQPGEVRRLLAFVGREVYEAAGGSIGESLFSLMGLTDDGTSVLGEPIVSDLPALRALAESKLDAAAKSLTSLTNAEGGPWAWARRADQMPKGWETWPRMEIPAPKIKERACVGCVVSIDGDGRLQVEDRIYWNASDRGRPANPKIRGEEDGGNAAATPSARPEAAVPPASSSVAADEDSGAPTEAEIVGAVVAAIEDKIAEIRSDPAREPGRDLSPRLQQQLAEQLTAGLRSAVKGRNDLALPLLLAAVASNGAVVGIGAHEPRPPEALWRFEEALENYAAMDLGGQLRALANIVAEAIDLTIRSGETPPAFMAGPQALLTATVRAMGRSRLRKHLVEAFDVEAFVKAAPKDVLLAAIAEACGPQQRERQAAKGKREIQEFARVNLAEKGWLPAELGAGALGAPVRPTPAAKKAAAHKPGAKRRPLAAKKRGR